MTKLEKLNNELNKKRIAYFNAIGDITNELCSLIGNENLVASDFPNEGLAFSTKHNDSNHAYIGKLIEILEIKGHIKIEDITDNNYL